MLSHPINFQPNPKCHRIHENQPDCSKIQFSMMMALHGNNTRIIFVRSIRPLSPLNNGSCFALYSEEGCGLDFPFWMYWFLSSGKRWIDHPKRGVSFHLQNSRKSIVFSFPLSINSEIGPIPRLELDFLVNLLGGVCLIRGESF